MDSIWKVAKGPTESIYKNILKRNRCNHRDYQNVAVNGEGIKCDLYPYELSFLIEGWTLNVCQKPCVFLLTRYVRYPAYMYVYRFKLACPHKFS